MCANGQWGGRCVPVSMSAILRINSRRLLSLTPWLRHRGPHCSRFPVGRNRRLLPSCCPHACTPLPLLSFKIRVPSLLAISRVRNSLWTANAKVSIRLVVSRRLKAVRMLNPACRRYRWGVPVGRRRVDNHLRSWLVQKAAEGEPPYLG